MNAIRSKSLFHTLRVNVRSLNEVYAFLSEYLVANINFALRFISNLLIRMFYD